MTDIANKSVHGFFELGRRREGLDRQRHDRLAGIGRFAGLFDEIDYLASYRRPIERPRKQRNNQTQALAFVIADREQITFVCALGVGQRFAFAIDHPADRHRFAAL